MSIAIALAAEISAFLLTRRYVAGRQNLFAKSDRLMSSPLWREIVISRECRRLSTESNSLTTVVVLRRINKKNSIETRGMENDPREVSANVEYHVE